MTAGLLWTACGPIPEPGQDPTTAPSTATFALADIGDVTLSAGARKDIQLLVLGAEGKPVQFSAQGLPAFATLTGDVISLAPQREHAGETLVKVTATSGELSASKQFTLRVTRTNVAPQMMNPYIWDVDGSIVIPVRSSDGTLVSTVRGLPKVAAMAKDDDKDGVQLFVELIPEGASFTGEATYVSPPSEGGTVDGYGQVMLADLEPEKPYRMRAWMKDTLGLSSLVWDFGRLIYSPRGKRSAAPDWRTCGEAQVNVTEDAQNCGACGHDCQGTSCQLGLCTATQLATMADTVIEGFELDASHVYWSGYSFNHHGAQRVSKTGGAVEPLTTSYDGPVAVDADALYVKQPTQLVRIPLAGGPETRLFWGGYAMEGLSLSGERLYWFQEATRSTWALYSVAKAGGELARREADFAARPQYTVVNATGAYAFDMAGGLLRWPAGGGSVKVLANDLYEPRGLAVDEHYVYVAHGPSECWGCATTTTLSRIPLEGGPREVLATVDMRVSGGLAVDAENLYWTQGDRIDNVPITLGSVVRMPKAGGTPLVLADGHSKVTQMRVDATHVYWAVPQVGIFRVAK